MCRRSNDAVSLWGRRQPFLVVLRACRGHGGYDLTYKGLRPRMGLVEPLRAHPSSMFMYPIVDWCIQIRTTYLAAGPEHPLPSGLSPDPLLASDLAWTLLRQ